MLYCRLKEEGMRKMKGWRIKGNWRSNVGVRGNRGKTRARRFVMSAIPR